MNMTNAIAALENLKDFENIPRGPVLMGSGCESATLRMLTDATADPCIAK